MTYYNLVHKHCGPFNTVSKTMPRNKVDRICWLHDKKYGKYGRQAYYKFNEADRRFIASMKKQPGMAPWLYRKVFQLKKYIAPVMKEKRGGLKRSRVRDFDYYAAQSRAKSAKSGHVASNATKSKKSVHFVKGVRDTMGGRSYRRRSRSYRRRRKSSGRSYKRKGFSARPKWGRKRRKFRSFSKRKLLNQISAVKSYYTESMGRIETSPNETRYHVLPPAGDNDYWATAVAQGVDDGSTVTGTTEPQAMFSLKSLQQSCTVRNQSNDYAFATVYSCTVRSMFGEDAVNTFISRVASELYNGFLDIDNADGDALFTHSAGTNFVSLNGLHKVSPYLSGRFVSRFKILKQVSRKLPPGESFTVSHSSPGRLMRRDKYIGTSAGDEAGWRNLTKFFIIRLRADIVEDLEVVPGTAPGTSQLNYMLSSKAKFCYVENHVPGADINGNGVTLGGTLRFAGRGDLTIKTEEDA